MVVLNEVSRFHIVMNALRHSTNPPKNAADLTAKCEDILKRHKKYSVDEMEDMPEITQWTWKY